MVCDSVELVYGYKIPENILRMVFETDDFKKYCFDAKPKKYQKNYTYEYNHFLFTEYLNNKLRDKNYGYKIYCSTLPCCTYGEKDKYRKYGTDFIIGFEIGQFGGFELEPINPLVFNDLSKYVPTLLKLLNDLKLHVYCDNTPYIYAMPNDCLSCT
ncbi:hypothetical protein QKU48_gp0825 [Fadolivirus algeromassiliense]|jgi:hypothetical protein|uniref:Uncharacterized protein n=1 Tax=Fadolivirus FV1/VV64 TaxID=3070911 RepID=A0A7D3QUN3_9VIRU|nr:hypothetical protein QKU48_gp0825 [Fadolivirus algeromassiliense]QKF94283.1 hypothetical protein Fadolivirus_1_825 [Fadolivirus FV1/VV64]